MKKISYIFILALVLGITSCASSGQKILFDANGGEGEIKEISVSKDGSVTLPKNSLTREGYNFIGWDVNNDEVFDFSDEESFKIQNTAEEIIEKEDKAEIPPLTFKAIWAPKSK